MSGSITSLALLVGLGGRILLDQLTRSGEPSAREFIVLGLWFGSGLHYVSTANKDLLLPAAALVGVKLFSDLMFDATRAMVTTLGIGLGYCFADLLSRWMDTTAEPSGRSRKIEHPTHRRRSRSEHAHRSEGDERRSSRREPSRRAVSDITSVDASSFVFQQDSRTLLTPIDREVAALRARASLADSERRRYKEERKWALEEGNMARAKEMSWQVKRYSALMKSFHREADDKLLAESGSRPHGSAERGDSDQYTRRRHDAPDTTDGARTDRQRSMRVHGR